MIKSIIFFILISFLSSCALFKKEEKDINSKEELFYEALNLILKEKHKKYQYKAYKFNCKDVPLKENVMPFYYKAMIPTFNCFVYQKKNFLYHYSYIDTISAPMFNTGISLDFLRNVCEAVNNPFLLDTNLSRYDYPIQLTKYDGTRCHINYVSPLIKRTDDKYDYEMYTVRDDWEGGFGKKYYFKLVNGKLSLQGSSNDPMDHFGCWHEEDYISKLCLE